MGFVKLPHSLLKWGWFSDAPTLRCYIWLLLKAAWCDTEYRNIKLKRGQVLVTYADICEGLNISVQQARTFFDRLERSGIITISYVSKYRVITLVDYEAAENDNSVSTAYQQDNNSIAAGYQQEGGAYTLYNKENNNLKKQGSPRATRAEIQEAPRASRGGSELEKSFERFWSAYPRKAAKQQAFKAWEKLAPDEGLSERIFAALELQKKSDAWTRDGGRYIVYPSKWLDNRRWEDELPPPDPSANAPVPSGSSTFTVDDLKRKIFSKYKN